MVIHLAPSDLEIQPQAAEGHAAGLVMLAIMPSKQKEPVKREIQFTPSASVLPYDQVDYAS